MANFTTVDFSETFLYDFDAGVMEKLLIDHTTQKNIMWCTDDYAVLGTFGFPYNKWLCNQCIDIAVVITGL